MLALSVDTGDAGFPDQGLLWSWMEQLELTALVPGIAATTPSLVSFRRQHQVQIPAIRMSQPMTSTRGVTASLTHPDSAQQRQWIEAAVKTAESATELRSPWVIVELGELRSEAPSRQIDWFNPDPQETADNGSYRQTAITHSSAFQEHLVKQSNSLLDAICRGLFEVRRRVPEVGLAIALPSGFPGLPTADMLEAILEDLDDRVGYWHDTGRARCLAELEHTPSEEVWMDRFADRCIGVDLTDCMSGFAGLPAGAGELDFVAIRAALGQGMVKVVRADPFPGPAPLRAAVDLLRGLGI